MPIILALIHTAQTSRIARPPLQKKTFSSSGVTKIVIFRECISGFIQATDLISRRNTTRLLVVERHTGTNYFRHTLFMICMQV